MSLNSITNIYICRVEIILTGCIMASTTTPIHRNARGWLRLVHHGHYLPHNLKYLHEALAREGGICNQRSPTIGSMYCSCCVLWEEGLEAWTPTSTSLSTAIVLQLSDSFHCPVEFMYSSCFMCRPCMFLWYCRKPDFHSTWTSLHLSMWPWNRPDFSWTWRRFSDEDQTHMANTRQSEIDEDPEIELRWTPGLSTEQCHLGVSSWDGCWD